MKPLALVLAGCLAALVACGGTNDAASDTTIGELADCNDTCQNLGIEPGVGVHLGGGSVRLGAPAADAEAVLGAPDRVLELSSQGRRRLQWPDLAVTTDAAGAVEVVEVLQTFPGTTVDGLGLGSDRAAVEATSPGVREPFLGALVDRSAGIAWVFESDVVVRAVVFAPTP